MEPGWKGYHRALGFAALLGLSGWIFAAGRLAGLDFIRGDSNSDEEVTLADQYFSLKWLFIGGPPPECADAADVDDSGVQDITDPIIALNYLYLDGNPPLAPFPAAGPDPTPSDSWFTGCAAYGNGSKLADPEAALKIGPAEIVGGPKGLVRVPVEIASSKKISGYAGRIKVGTDLLPDQSIGDAALLRDDSLANYFYIVVRAKGGEIHFAVLLNIVPPPGRYLPPGKLATVLNIPFCLKPGTPAGTYPLTLEAGELVDHNTGRSIAPALESGSLSVLSEITGADCDLKPPNFPPPPPPVEILFKLGEGVGAPGSPATIPFTVRSDRASQGFSFSVDFDESILQADDLTKLWQKPDGTPYEFSAFEIDNADNLPGRSGMEEGYLVGVAVISLTDTFSILPPSREVDVLNLNFRIRPEAPVGTTEVQFVDGGRGSGGPVSNKLIAGGTAFTPNMVDSFIFVNGRINIIDVAVFIRGDSNGDGEVDISDARFTLESLFLGGPAPRCLDAADANDDGEVDLSDPIAALMVIYRGIGEIPPPYGKPGRDPTPDNLGC